MRVCNTSTHCEHPLWSPPKHVYLFKVFWNLCVWRISFASSAMSQHRQQARLSRTFETNVQHVVGGNNELIEGRDFPNTHSFSYNVSRCWGPLVVQTDDRSTQTALTPILVPVIFWARPRLAGGAAVTASATMLARRGLEKCEGCDIVQSDHAPQAGVAQGIFHGDLIRRRDGHQVELEEELEEEVERRVRRDHSRNKTQVRMHG